MSKDCLKVYNTLTGQKEVFTPLNPPVVKMYTCGPTTYNYIHLGNARPLVVFDTVRRYLEYLGYEVTFVQNFTDVDDKIIKKSSRGADLGSGVVRKIHSGIFCGCRCS